jgi:hypothetical protein
MLQVGEGVVISGHLSQPRKVPVGFDLHRYPIEARIGYLGNISDIFPLVFSVVNENQAGTWKKPIVSYFNIL